jgi:S-formylglutathione hydrolase FrmB
MKKSKIPISGKKSQIAVFLLLTTVMCYSQSGQIVLDSIQSKFLAQTITQENPNRQLAIYLPRDYTASTKRYPVLYLLHGIGDTQKEFTGDTIQNNNIKDLMNAGIDANKFGEMIIVMPNENTNLFGSFYTNSSVTGNWADFTTIELVDFIDTKYRTIAKASSRAVAGHSMGGFGALTLAMKHPDIFSVTYGMNAALICFCGEITPNNPAIVKSVKAKNLDELLATQSSIAIGLLTVSQAFSPNPSRPPFYADKPFKIQGTKLVPNTEAYNKWMANNPVLMAEKYKANLLKLKAIKFDSGNDDEYLFIIENNRLFSRKLTTLNIPHQFEEYNGNHRNTLWGLGGRIYNEMLPFVFDNIGK